MTEELERLEIVSEKKIFDDFSAVVYSNNLIEIIWSPELKEVEKKHLVQLKDVIKAARKEKKMLVYFSPHPMLTMSKEALHYGGSEEAQANTFANAVLTNSIASMLMFNFFMRINKPATPTKSFSKRGDAIAWLLKKQSL